MTARNDRLYVYALAEPGLPRQFTVLGHRLRSLPLDGVDVVIEHRPPPDFTTDAVRRQHAIVTRLASRQPAILPARFGSVGRRSLLAVPGIAASQGDRGGARAGAGLRADDRAHRDSDGSDGLDPLTGLGRCAVRRPRLERTDWNRVPEARAWQRARHVPPEVEILRRELGSLRQVRTGGRRRTGGPRHRVSSRPAPEAGCLSPARLRTAVEASAAHRQRHRSVAGVRVRTRPVLIPHEETVRSSKQKPSPPRKRPKPSIATVEIAELEAMRGELERFADDATAALERRPGRRPPLGREAGAHARRVHPPVARAAGDPADGRRHARPPTRPKRSVWR